MTHKQFLGYLLTLVPAMLGAVWLIVSAHAAQPIHQGSVPIEQYRDLLHKIEKLDRRVGDLIVKTERIETTLKIVIGPGSGRE